MDFEVRREMITFLHDGQLRELLERDQKQGKFWFRLYINGCPNTDELNSCLLGIGLLDFQARQICIDFGDYTNDTEERIADLFGVKEGGIMSFMVAASTEEELEGKINFFMSGVKQMKEAVDHCLLHRIPEWVREEKKITLC